MTYSQRVRTRAKNQTNARRQRITLLWVLILVLAGICLYLLLWGGGKSPTPVSPVMPTVPADAAASTEAGQTAVPETLPEGWEWRQMSQSELSEGTLVLVNRDYGFDPAKPRLITVYENKTDSYLVKDVYLSVRSDTMEALNRWMDDFAAETGCRDVNIVAGHRTYSDQDALYDNALNNRGKEYADAYLALPGHSEHHTGLAVDLDLYDLATGTSSGFEGEGEYAWAVDHAWEYGFVQRYPPAKSDITGINYESWHFRYVSRPHSDIMAREDLCLEEYIAYLRDYPFTGDHLTGEWNGQAYEIYYCPGTRIPVPVDGSYTVSGNNVDGFVVTVLR